MAAKKHSDGQRREFLTIVDRGGTVRAAVLAVGVSANAGIGGCGSRGWASVAGYPVIRDDYRFRADAVTGIR